MPRRVSLPTVDDLFRSTAGKDASRAESGIRVVPAHADKPADAQSTSDQGETATSRSAGRKSSGRVRHDEKMTVYVTSAELLDLEHARLSLRAAHGLAVDRGRVVREALAMVLADFEANGDDSALVRRLTQEP